MLLYRYRPEDASFIEQAQFEIMKTKHGEYPPVAMLCYVWSRKLSAGTAVVNPRSDRIQVVSDHRDTSFGTAYGVLIKELRLLARAVFVVDGGGTVRYVEIVPEMTEHPNYEAALAAVTQAAK